MKYMEISPPGNFDSWSPLKLEELKSEKISSNLGNELLFENENVRIWQVFLLPNERLPYRKINLDHCWVAITNSMAISRFADGKIILMHMNKGDSNFLDSIGKNIICDLENIGEDTLIIQMTEFKEGPLNEKLQIQESSNPYFPRNL